MRDGRPESESTARPIIEVRDLRTHLVIHRGGIGTPPRCPPAPGALHDVAGRGPGRPGRAKLEVAAAEPPSGAERLDRGAEISGSWGTVP